jgi:hypothetical protein
MESIFGETDKFLGTKFCRNNSEIFIRPLKKLADTADFGV